MIEWDINSNRARKFTKIFMDLLLVKLCLDNDLLFDEYIYLLEVGNELDNNFPENITRVLIDNIKNLDIDR